MYIYIEMPSILISQLFKTKETKTNTRPVQTEHAPLATSKSLLVLLIDLPGFGEHQRQGESFAPQASREARWGLGGGLTSQKHCLEIAKKSIYPIEKINGSKDRWMAGWIG